jgi:hypothetical protein
VPTARRAPALAVDRRVPVVAARDGADRARVEEEVDERRAADRVAAVRAGDDERRARGAARFVPEARAAGLRAGRSADLAGVRPVPPARALRPAEVERPDPPRVVTAQPRDRA